MVTMGNSTFLAAILTGMVLPYLGHRQIFGGKGAMENHSCRLCGRDRLFVVSAGLRIYPKNSLWLDPRIHSQD
jgi:hypothetical protein